MVFWKEEKAMSGTAIERRANGATELDGWNAERLDLLRRTICEKATPVEMELFIATCRRTGLDPFARQIYFIKYGSQSPAIVTGIDGYRLIADRSGAYAGSDEPEFFGTAEGGYPELARVTVWKLVQGTRCPFTASARWSEYYPGNDGKGQMWRKMPHTMLGKVCEALALRKAFPQELSGLYTREEMDQAEPAERVDTRTGEVLPALAPVAARAAGTMERQPSYTAATSAVREPVKSATPGKRLGGLFKSAGFGSGEERRRYAEYALGRVLATPEELAQDPGAMEVVAADLEDRETARKHYHAAYAAWAKAAGQAADDKALRLGLDWEVLERDRLRAGPAESSNEYSARELRLLARHYEQEAEGGSADPFADDDPGSVPAGAKGLQS